MAVFIRPIKTQPSPGRGKTWRRTGQGEQGQAGGLGTQLGQGSGVAGPYLLLGARRARGAARGFLREKSLAKGSTEA